MDAKKKKYPIDNNMLCQGCFSKGRTLTPLKESHRTVLQKFDVTMALKNNFLCWECTSMLNKMCQFAENVQSVQRILKVCLECNVTLNSPSPKSSLGFADIHITERKIGNENTFFAIDTETNTVLPYEPKVTYTNLNIKRFSKGGINVDTSEKKYLCPNFNDTLNKNENANAETENPNAKTNLPELNTTQLSPDIGVFIGPDTKESTPENKCQEIRHSKPIETSNKDKEQPEKQEGGCFSKNEDVSSKSSKIEDSLNNIPTIPKIQTRKLYLKTIQKVKEKDTLLKPHDSIERNQTEQHKTQSSEIKQKKKLGRYVNANKQNIIQNSDSSTQGDDYVDDFDNEYSDLSKPDGSDPTKGGHFNQNASILLNNDVTIIPITGPEWPRVPDSEKLSSQITKVDSKNVDTHVKNSENIEEKQPRPTNSISSTRCKHLGPTLGSWEKTDVVKTRAEDDEKTLTVSQKHVSDDKDLQAKLVDNSKEKVVVYIRDIEKEIINKTITTSLTTKRSNFRKALENVINEKSATDSNTNSSPSCSVDGAQVTMEIGNLTSSLNQKRNEEDQGQGQMLVETKVKEKLNKENASKNILSAVTSLYSLMSQNNVKRCKPMENTNKNKASEVNIDTIIKQVNSLIQTDIHKTELKLKSQESSTCQASPKTDSHNIAKIEELSKLEDGSQTSKVEEPKKRRRNITQTGVLYKVTDLRHKKRERIKVKHKGKKVEAQKKVIGQSETTNFVIVKEYTSLTEQATVTEQTVTNAKEVKESKMQLSKTIDNDVFSHKPLTNVVQQTSTQFIEKQNIDTISCNNHNTTVNLNDEPKTLNIDNRVMGEIQIPTYVKKFEEYIGKSRRPMPGQFKKGNQLHSKKGSVFTMSEELQTYLTSFKEGSSLPDITKMSDTRQFESVSLSEANYRHQLKDINIFVKDNEKDVKNSKEICTVLMQAPTETGILQTIKLEHQTHSDLNGHDIIVIPLVELAPQDTMLNISDNKLLSLDSVINSCLHLNNVAIQKNSNDLKPKDTGTQKDGLSKVPEAPITGPNQKEFDIETEITGYVVKTKPDAGKGCKMIVNKVLTSTKVKKSDSESLAGFPVITSVQTLDITTGDQIDQPSVPYTFNLKEHDYYHVYPKITKNETGTNTTTEKKTKTIQKRATPAVIEDNNPAERNDGSMQHESYQNDGDVIKTNNRPEDRISESDQNESFTYLPVLVNATSITEDIFNSQGSQETDNEAFPIITDVTSISEEHFNRTCQETDTENYETCEDQMQQEDENYQQDQETSDNFYGEAFNYEGINSEQQEIYQYDETSQNGYHEYYYGDETAEFEEQSHQPTLTEHDYAVPDDEDTESAPETHDYQMDAKHQNDLVQFDDNALDDFEFEQDPNNLSESQIKDIIGGDLNDKGKKKLNREDGEELLTEMVSRKRRRRRKRGNAKKNNKKKENKCPDNQGNYEKGANQDLQNINNAPRGSSLMERDIKKLRSIKGQRTEECANETADEGRERETAAWRNSMLLVVDRLRVHKYAAGFLYAVKEKCAPQYYDIIKRPMDLSTIRKNVKEGVIRTTEEFERDLLLMISNALIYNSSDHLTYFLGTEFLKEIKYQLQVLRSINEVNTVINSIMERKRALCEKEFYKINPFGKTTILNISSISKDVFDSVENNVCVETRPKTPSKVAAASEKQDKHCTNISQTDLVLKVTLERLPDYILSDLETFGYISASYIEADSRNNSNTSLDKSNTENKAKGNSVAVEPTNDFEFESFAQNLLEDQPLLQPIGKRRRKTLLLGRSTPINFNDESNSNDSFTEMRTLGNKINITQVLDTIIGVNAEGIEFYNDKDLDEHKTNKPTATDFRCSELELSEQRINKDTHTNLKIENTDKNGEEFNEQTEQHEHVSQVRHVYDSLRLILGCEGEKSKSNNERFKGAKIRDKKSDEDLPSCTVSITLEKNVEKTFQVDNDIQSWSNETCCIEKNIETVIDSDTQNTIGDEAIQRPETLVLISENEERGTEQTLNYGKENTIRYGEETSGELEVIEYTEACETVAFEDQEVGFAQVIENDSQVPQGLGQHTEILNYVVAGNTLELVEITTVNGDENDALQETDTDCLVSTNVFGNIKRPTEEIEIGNREDHTMKENIGKSQEEAQGLTVESSRESVSIDAKVVNTNITLDVKNISSKTQRISKKNKKCKHLNDDHGIQKRKKNGNTLTANESPGLEELFAENAVIIEPKGKKESKFVDVDSILNSHINDSTANKEIQVFNDFTIAPDTRVTDTTQDMTGSAYEDRVYHDYIRPNIRPLNVIASEHSSKMNKSVTKPVNVPKVNDPQGISEPNTPKLANTNDDTKELKLPELMIKISDVRSIDDQSKNKCDKIKAKKLKMLLTPIKVQVLKDGKINKKHSTLPVHKRPKDRRKRTDGGDLITLSTSEGGTSVYKDILKAKTTKKVVKQSNKKGKIELRPMFNNQATPYSKLTENFAANDLESKYQNEVKLLDKIFDKNIKKYENIRKYRIPLTKEPLTPTKTDNFNAEQTHKEKSADGFTESAETAKETTATNSVDDRSVKRQDFNTDRTRKYKSVDGIIESVETTKKTNALDSIGDESNKCFNSDHTQKHHSHYGFSESVEKEKSAIGSVGNESNKCQGVNTDNTQKDKSVDGFMESVERAKDTNALESEGDESNKIKGYNTDHIQKDKSVDGFIESVERAKDTNTLESVGDESNKIEGFKTDYPQKHKSVDDFTESVETEKETTAIGSVGNESNNCEGVTTDNTLNDKSVDNVTESIKLVKEAVTTEAERKRSDNCQNLNTYDNFNETIDATKKTVTIKTEVDEYDNRTVFETDCTHKAESIDGYMESKETYCTAVRETKSDVKIEQNDLSSINISRSARMRRKPKKFTNFVHLDYFSNDLDDMSFTSFEKTTVANIKRKSSLTSAPRKYVLKTAKVVLNKLPDSVLNQCQKSPIEDTNHLESTNLERTSENQVLPTLSPEKCGLPKVKTPGFRLDRLDVLWEKLQTSPDSETYINAGQCPELNSLTAMEGTTKCLSEEITVMIEESTIQKIAEICTDPAVGDTPEKTIRTFGEGISENLKDITTRVNEGGTTETEATELGNTDNMNKAVLLEERAENLTEKNEGSTNENISEENKQGSIDIRRKSIIRGEIERTGDISEEKFKNRVEDGVLKVETTEEFSKNTSEEEEDTKHIVETLKALDRLNNLGLTIRKKGTVKPAVKSETIVDDSQSSDEDNFVFETAESTAAVEKEISCTKEIYKETLNESLDQNISQDHNHSKTKLDDKIDPSSSGEGTSAVKQEIYCPKGIKIQPLNKSLAQNISNDSHQSKTTSGDKIRKGYKFTSKIAKESPMFATKRKGGWPKGMKRKIKTSEHIRSSAPDSSTPLETTTFGSKRSERNYLTEDKGPLIKTKRKGGWPKGVKRKHKSTENASDISTIPEISSNASSSSELNKEQIFIKADCCTLPRSNKNEHSIEKDNFAEHEQSKVSSVMNKTISQDVSLTIDLPLKADNVFESKVTDKSVQSDEISKAVMDLPRNKGLPKRLKQKRSSKGIDVNKTKNRSRCPKLTTLTFEESCKALESELSLSFSNESNLAEPRSENLLVDKKVLPLIDESISADNSDPVNQLVLPLLDENTHKINLPEPKTETLLVYENLVPFVDKSCSSDKNNLVGQKPEDIHENVEPLVDRSSSSDKNNVEQKSENLFVYNEVEHLVDEGSFADKGNPAEPIIESLKVDEKVMKPVQRKGCPKGVKRKSMPNVGMLKRNLGSDLMSSKTIKNRIKNYSELESGLSSRERNEEVTDKSQKYAHSSTPQDRIDSPSVLSKIQLKNLRVIRKKRGWPKGVKRKLTSNNDASSSSATTHISNQINENKIDRNNKAKTKSVLVHEKVMKPVRRKGWPKGVKRKSMPDVGMLKRNLGSDLMSSETIKNRITNYSELESGLSSKERNEEVTDETQKDAHSSTPLDRIDSPNVVSEIQSKKLRVIRKKRGWPKGVKRTLTPNDAPSSRATTHISNQVNENKIDRNNKADASKTSEDSLQEISSNDNHNEAVSDILPQGSEKNVHKTAVFGHTSKQAALVHVQKKACKNSQKPEYLIPKKKGWPKGVKRKPLNTGFDKSSVSSNIDVTKTLLNKEKLHDSSNKDSFASNENNTTDLEHKNVEKIKEVPRRRRKRGKLLFVLKRYRKDKSSFVINKSHKSIDESLIEKKSKCPEGEDIPLEDLLKSVNENCISEKELSKMPNPDMDMDLETISLSSETASNSTVINVLPDTESNTSELLSQNVFKQPEDRKSLVPQPDVDSLSMSSENSIDFNITSLLPETTANMCALEKTQNALPRFDMDAQSLSSDISLNSDICNILPNNSNDVYKKASQNAIVQSELEQNITAESDLDNISTTSEMSENSNISLCPKSQSSDGKTNLRRRRGKKGWPKGKKRKISNESFHNISLKSMTNDQNDFCKSSDVGMSSEIDAFSTAETTDVKLSPSETHFEDNNPQTEILSCSPLELSDSANTTAVRNDIIAPKDAEKPEKFSECSDKVNILSSSFVEYSLRTLQQRTETKDMALQVAEKMDGFSEMSTENTTFKCQKRKMKLESKSISQALTSSDLSIKINRPKKKKCIGKIIDELKTAPKKRGRPFGAKTRNLMYKPRNKRNTRNDKLYESKETKDSIDNVVENINVKTITENKTHVTGETSDKILENLSPKTTPEDQQVNIDKKLKTPKEEKEMHIDEMFEKLKLTDKTDICQIPDAIGDIRNTSEDKKICTHKEYDYEKTRISSDIKVQQTADTIKELTEDTKLSKSDQIVSPTRTTSSLRLFRRNKSSGTPISPCAALYSNLKDLLNVGSKGAIDMTNTSKNIVGSQLYIDSKQSTTKTDTRQTTFSIRSIIGQENEEIEHKINIDSTDPNIKPVYNFHEETLMNSKSIDGEQNKPSTAVDQGECVENMPVILLKNNSEERTFLDNSNHDISDLSSEDNMPITLLKSKSRSVDAERNMKIPFLENDSDENMPLIYLKNKSPDSGKDAEENTCLQSKLCQLRDLSSDDSTTISLLRNESIENTQDLELNNGNPTAMDMTITAENKSSDDLIPILFQKNKKHLTTKKMPKNKNTYSPRINKDISQIKGCIEKMYLEEVCKVSKSYDPNSAVVTHKEKYPLHGEFENNNASFENTVSQSLVKGRDKQKSKSISNLRDFRKSIKPKDENREKHDSDNLVENTGGDVIDLSKDDIFKSNTCISLTQTKTDKQLSYLPQKTNNLFENTGGDVIDLTSDDIIKSNTCISQTQTQIDVQLSYSPQKITTQNTQIKNATAPDKILLNETEMKSNKIKLVFKDDTLNSDEKGRDNGAMPSQTNTVKALKSYKEKIAFEDDLLDSGGEEKDSGTILSQIDTVLALLDKQLASSDEPLDLTAKKVKELNPSTNERTNAQETTSFRSYNSDVVILNTVKKEESDSSSHERLLNDISLADLSFPEKNLKEDSKIKKKGLRKEKLKPAKRLKTVPKPKGRTFKRELSLSDALFGDPYEFEEFDDTFDLTRNDIKNMRSPTSRVLLLNSTSSQSSTDSTKSPTSSHSRATSSTSFSLASSSLQSFASRMQCSMNPKIPSSVSYKDLKKQSPTYSGMQYPEVPELESPSPSSMSTSYVPSSASSTDIALSQSNVTHTTKHTKDVHKGHRKRGRPLKIKRGPKPKQKQ